MLSSVILPFLVYALILFVAIYIIVDQAQDYLYGEPTPGMPLKVAVGTLILAGMLTWTRTNFATMFTDDIGKTTLQAIAWVGVFILIFRFQPWHGFGFGLAAMLILASLSGLAVDSMFAARPASSYESPTINKPIRRSMGPAVPATPTSPPVKK